MNTVLPPSQPVLVSDFDGTMTLHDFFRLAQAQLVPPGTPDYWEDYQAGQLTHFEALRRIFAEIRANEASVLAAAHAMDMDPQLGPAVQRLQQAGWHIVVASAGCDWYITRLLAEAEVMVEVNCNPASLDPQGGLLMSLPTGSPYFSPETGIDKEAVVRAAVVAHDRVAFAGDGRPDYPAALLVPPTRRFACGWLAETFTGEGIPFRRFERWSEIAGMLLEDASC